MQIVHKNGIPQKDIDTLRELAKKVREVSESPENREKREAWHKLNALQAKRPIVLAYPAPAWGEVITEQQFVCENSEARGLEMQLRQMLYHHYEIRDDKVIEPFITMYWEMDTGDLYGFEFVKHQGGKQNGGNHGSYVWEAPMKDLARDMEKLKPRVLTVYKEKTLERKAMAEQIFGDMIGVKLHHQFWHTAGITHHVTQLVGLQEFMILPYDDPDGLHQLFGWLRDEHVAFNKKMEEAGILELDHDGGEVGSGGYGYTDQLPGSDYKEGKSITMKHVWGFANSQESVGFSPDMYKEFIFPYERDIIEPFGLNCYGCCEPIHARLDTVMQFPNLRRISVSPWSDVNICAQKIQKDFVYSWKPNPSLVCTHFSEEGLRKVTREALSAAGHLNMEIILKDVETLQNNPQRLSKWVEITRQEIEKMSS